MLEITGESQYVDLNASGASMVGGFGFIIEDIDIDLSGASKASFTVIDDISGRVSGASQMNYKGNPNVDVNILDAATVKKVD